MTCTRYTRDMVGRSQNGDVFVLETEYMKLRAEVARLSALADRWNIECDEMREDNRRLAAELAMAEAEQRECTHDCNQGRDCTCRADHIGDTTGMVKLLADIERCYRMLLSEPDTKGALFKAENILREAIADAKGGSDD